MYEAERIVFVPVSKYHRMHLFQRGRPFERRFEVWRKAAEQKFGSIDLLRTRIHLDGVEATKIARRLQPALLLEEETGQ